MPIHLQLEEGWLLVWLPNYKQADLRFIVDADSSTPGALMRACLPASRKAGQPPEAVRVKNPGLTE